MTTLGFIGGGRVARIMLEGWKRAGVLPPAVKVTDTNTALAAQLASDFPGTEVASLDEVAAQDIVIVGLHPPVAAEVLPAIAGKLRSDAIVLSLAPKLRFETLAKLLGGFTRLARQNPNAASIIDKGYNPIAFADGLDDKARDQLRRLVTPLGEAPEVDEKTLEAYAVISAMGPTYLWFQLDLLRQLAGEFGLSETAARQAVAAMAHGATATLLESDLPGREVLDLVPVKPLAEDEPDIVAHYRQRLVPLYQKLAS